MGGEIAVRRLLRVSAPSTVLIDGLEGLVQRYERGTEVEERVESGHLCSESCMYVYIVLKECVLRQRRESGKAVRRLFQRVRARAPGTDLIVITCKGRNIRVLTHCSMCVSPIL